VKHISIGIYKRIPVAHLKKSVAHRHLKANRGIIDSGILEGGAGKREDGACF